MSFEEQPQPPVPNTETRSQSRTHLNRNMWQQLVVISGFEGLLHTLIQCCGRSSVQCDEPTLCLQAVHVQNSRVDKLANRLARAVFAVQMVKSHPARIHHLPRTHQTQGKTRRHATFQQTVVLCVWSCICNIRHAVAHFQMSIMWSLRSC